MKQLFLIIGLLLGLSHYSTAHTYPDKTTLSGLIKDKSTGERLPGVSVYFPDLKVGAVSNDEGYYLLENLPKTKVLVQITFLGYKAITQSLDLSRLSTQDFDLEESINEVNEVVITGLSKAQERSRTASPITSISIQQLQQSAATNIIDAVAKQPGISQITTGSGISKPVIRGLGFNRVLVLNDGIRQEGQQWGSEHGIEVDEFAINSIEILKGPASLAYGSDAIAGVINLLAAPTLPNGKIKANVLSNYQTNNGLIAYSANVAGNRKGFIWDLRYSNKQAHAYQNAYDGYVYNSGFKEHTLSGIIGLNKSWGYSHLHLSAYNLTPGIVEGERDSATGKFTKLINNQGLDSLAKATSEDLRAYASRNPYQQIYHYKAVLNNSFIMRNGTLKASLGFQQNRRQEYGDIVNPNTYGLYFYMNTLNYDVHYLFPENNNFNLSIGINGMQQSSQNKGTEFLIPEYHLFDIGSFVIAKKNVGKWDFSGGLRYDTRMQQGLDLYIDTLGMRTEANTMGAYQQFTAFSSRFSGISGSIGATYQFSEQVYTKLNFSRGFRAPNSAEIGANGAHEGSIRYEIGNPQLKAEQSLQIDHSWGVNSKHLSVELDLFANQISNFIFSHKLNSTLGGDSIRDGFTVFKYIQGNAALYGGEVSVDIHPHPLDWLHFENAFSYVQSIQGGQPDSTKYLPFTPAPKFTSELRANKRKWGKYFSNVYVKVGVESYLQQNHYYKAFETETATPAYTLVNAGIGTDFNKANKTLFSLYITASNLLDVAYQSHLSRLKYAAVNETTGRTGVYNMGRNISFKLLIPISIVK